MTLEPQLLTEMYRRMVTIRTFDRLAVEEFHAGNIPGVVHSYIGEEAVAVGVCSAFGRLIPSSRACWPEPRAQASPFGRPTASLSMKC